jgi:lipopolysaccharide transport system permease protein
MLTFLSLPASLIRTLWRHRELFRQLCRREISDRTKGSLLGLLWLVLNPLLLLALYTFVFGVLFSGRFGVRADETGLQFAVGVYIGLTIVGLINETIGSAPFMIVGRSNLVKKVVMPIELLPLSRFASIFIKLLINSVLWIICATLVSSGTWSLKLLWLPVLLLPACLLALGIAWALSAACVYLRDLEHLTASLAQVVFWTGGVFFSLARVAEFPVLAAILRWNPVLQINEGLRSALLWERDPGLFSLLHSYLSGIVCCWVGLAIFMRLKGRFVDNL